MPTTIGHELLRVLLPQVELCRLSMFFLKVKHLTTFLQHVGHLAVGAFWCYSVLITFTLILFEKQKFKIKDIKMVLKLFKLAKQSCNM